MPVVNYYKSIVRNRPQSIWPEEYVYIGRPGRGLRGIFGNHIKPGDVCPECGDTHKEPADTIPCYEKWLNIRVVEDLDFRNQVKNLHNKKLVCFCHPKPCHGEILEYVSNKLNEETNTLEYE